MGLNFYLSKPMPTDVFEQHMVGQFQVLARACGLEQALWEPEANGYVFAKNLIFKLEIALAWLKRKPERFKGLVVLEGVDYYNWFVGVIEKLLAACKEHPDAEIRRTR